MGKATLPDLKERFLEGASGAVGQEKEAGLPNIKGSMTYIAESWANYGVATGAFIKNKAFSCMDTPQYTDTSRTGKVIFDASESNAIYGNSETVQPASYTVNYLIKAY